MHTPFTPKNTLYELYEDRDNNANFWFSRTHPQFGGDISYALFFAGKTSGAVERERTTSGANYGWPEVLAANFDMQGTLKSVEIVSSPYHRFYDGLSEPTWWNKRRQEEFYSEGQESIDDYHEGDLYRRRKHWTKNMCKHGRRATRCRICYEAGEGGGSIPGIDMRCEHDSLIKNCVICSPQEVMASRLRGRISAVIKGSKSKSTMELVGCDISDFIAHIESQFQLGMKMDNYGRWHIDHRKPCASFDLTDEEEQKKCFHFTNLQPLWGKENLSKGAKFNEEDFGWYWTEDGWIPRES